MARRLLNPYTLALDEDVYDDTSIAMELDSVDESARPAEKIDVTELKKSERIKKTIADAAQQAIDEVN